MGFSFTGGKGIVVSVNGIGCLWGSGSKGFSVSLMLRIWVDSSVFGKEGVVSRVMSSILPSDAILGIFLSFLTGLEVGVLDSLESIVSLLHLPFLGFASWSIESSSTLFSGASALLLLSMFIILGCLMSFLNLHFLVMSLSFCSSCYSFSLGCQLTSVNCYN